MAQHPLTLAVRFGLEITALVAYGVWGWHAGEGALRLGLAVGLPLLAALLWGAVVAPRAALAAPGWVVLTVEALIFGGAVWATATRAPTLALVFAALVIAHEVAAYDRIVALIQGAPR
jgi:hypothetical protein